jgi:hypothetical protein
LIHTTSCFLGLNQHNSSVSNSALDLVFTNINDLCVSISNYPVVTSDNYHSPLYLHFKLTFDCQPAFLTHQCNYGQGDYLSLYNTLSNCGWSSVLNENSVHSAVYNLTASVLEAINKAISSLKLESGTFPDWFSKSLIFFTLRRKISFLRNIINLNLIIITVFFHIIYTDY